MTKAVKFQALNTFKPYAVFYRTGGQIEKFHFIKGNLEIKFIFS